MAQLAGVARGEWRAAAQARPGSLRFSIYDQVIQAALGGQGVALGRLPMVSELLDIGRLVAPFPKRYESQRGYYVLVAPHARERARRHRRSSRSCASRRARRSGCARPRVSVEQKKCPVPGRRRAIIDRRRPHHIPAPNRRLDRPFRAAVRAGRARARSRERTRSACALVRRARDAPSSAVDRDESALARLDSVASVDDARARPRRPTRGRSRASASTRSSSPTTCIGRGSALLDVLARDGVLLYETFARGQRSLRPARRTRTSCSQRDELVERVRGRLVGRGVRAGPSSSKRRERPSCSALPRSGPAAHWPPRCPRHRPLTGRRRATGNRGKIAAFCPHPISC